MAGKPRIAAKRVTAREQRSVELLDAFHTVLPERCEQPTIFRRSALDQRTWQTVLSRGRARTCDFRVMRHFRPLARAP